MGKQHTRYSHSCWVAARQQSGTGRGTDRISGTKGRKANADSGQPNAATVHPFGSEVAATPDARFIYDSIDAAKSLLSTFNSFVDPYETFRFMPLRYYLYVIYSACFLYKSTGIMGGDSRGSVKRIITDTIDRLQKASACKNYMV